MGCANSRLKVVPEELIKEKTHKQRRPKSWKFWKRVIARCNKVRPVPEHKDLDEFQLRLINKSRPKSAPKQIGLELYVPDLGSSEDEPPTSISPNKLRRSGVRLPPLPAKQGMNKKTGKRTVNMLDHLAKQGIFTASSCKAPEQEIEGIKGSVAFKVCLDKRPLPPPPHFKFTTKPWKNVVSKKDIEGKLEKATERREQQATQKQERLRLKSARVDKVRRAMQNAEKATHEEAKKELSQKITQADERRQHHTTKTTNLMRLKSAKVRAVQEANAAKKERMSKLRSNDIRSKLEDSHEKRVKLQKDKIIRVKQVAKAKFTERDWQRCLEKARLKKEEEARLKSATDKQKEEEEATEDEFRYSIFDDEIETYHASSSEESLDSFYA